MKVELGHNVKVHYVGTLADGTEFDNSRRRGDALYFQVGDNRMISGFSQAVLGMDPGQTKKFTLAAEDAYGHRNPAATREVPISDFDGIDIQPGGMIRGSTAAGPFLAEIVSVEDETVTLDMNHPLAGKELSFEVELLDNTGRQIIPEDPVPTQDEESTEE